MGDHISWVSHEPPPGGVVGGAGGRFLAGQPPVPWSLRVKMKNLRCGTTSGQGHLLPAWSITLSIPDSSAARAPSPATLAASGRYGATRSREAIAIPSETLTRTTRPRSSEPNTRYI